MDYQTYLRERAPQLLQSRQKYFDFMRETFGTEPEFPWLQYPLYCTFKTTARQKWYAIMMYVTPRCLGLAGKQMLDVMNVKAAPKVVAALIDHQHYFPAYHMNQRHWVSILLDANTDWAQVQDLLRCSYHLADRR